MEGRWGGEWGGGMRRREGLEVCVCIRGGGGRRPEGVETNKSPCRLCADTQLV